MTATNRIDPPKAWWCSTCGRATVTCYRCSNYDCGADVARARCGLTPDDPSLLTNDGQAGLGAFDA